MRPRRRRYLIESLCVFLSARNREKRLYVGSILKRHNSILTSQYCPSCPARKFRTVPRGFDSKAIRLGKTLAKFWKKLSELDLVKLSSDTQNNTLINIDVIHISFTFSSHLFASVLVVTQDLVCQLIFNLFVAFLFLEIPELIHCTWITSIRTNIVITRVWFNKDCIKHIKKTHPA